MENLPQQPAAYRITHQLQDAKLTVYLAGEFGIRNLAAFVGDINRLLVAEQREISGIDLDFSGITYFDSAAALAVIRVREETPDKKIKFSFVNLNEEIRDIFSVINNKGIARRPTKAIKPREGILVQIGDTCFLLGRDFINMITFVGELIYALSYTIIHPRSLRSKDVLFYMKRAGVDGLPIVGLISVLMGLIMAFMSFLQLKQIGANIYVPSLVSFAMVKELGPLMTAILVAGRSGSAFAAEIGTMVVNEEVDALKTMGFDPIRFIAVPKVLAAMLVVPLLTLYADLFGVFGGLIVGVTGLDLTFNTYIVQSMKTIKVFDVVTSLIKAAVFAALIAGIGCQRGFQVRSGAQDVGKYTTSAVVSAIFMIVVADSIFAIMLHYVR
ncbi:MAG TPA: ABC transporter permease [Smithellaceae bacterium]|nr:ABC transporter permease [Smithellaceae bacterium]